MSDNTEIIISMLKIKDNIKKYYWVCILTVVISIIAACILTLSGDKTKKGSAADTAQKYYQADAMIQVKANDTGKKIVIKDYNDAGEAEVYSDINYNLVANFATFGSSTEIRNKVNKALADNNYSELCSTDGVGIGANAGNIIVISITGLNDSKRTEFISNTYADLILETGNVLFTDDLDSSRIISAAKAYSVTKNSNGSFTKTYNVSLNDEDKPDTSVSDTENLLSVKSIFNKTNIMLVVIGVFAGVGIILIMVIRDKKLRTRDDVDNMFKIGYLGESGKDETQNQLTATAIESRCVNDDISSVIVTTAADNVSLDILVDFADRIGDAVSKKTMPGIEFNSETVRELNKADGVILVIASGRDDSDTIGKALDRIKIVKANLLGYVIQK